MIYLLTGANGSGKTLTTLEMVREKQVKEGRSVYYNGFDLKPEKAAEFGWQTFDPVKWQDLPDGAILICDECQDQFPLRATNSTVPDYVQKLAVHRKRGFDFYLITQHPANIDKFIRGLIGSPGWHRHLKRVFGSEMVSVLQWSSCNLNCEKAGAGKSAQVTMQPYPKHVYDWYISTTLNTAKKQIPRQVWFLAAAVLAVPVMGYLAYSKLMHNVTKRADPLAVAAAGTGTGVAPKVSDPLGDYFASYRPRIDGFPHTAPRYDEVTAPVHAPYPAACIESSKGCNCYTQQGTVLPVSLDVCSQIVKGGFFIEWDTEPERESGRSPGQAGGLPVAAEKRSAHVYMPPPPVLGRQSASDGSVNVTSAPAAMSPASTHDGEVIRSMRAVSPLL